jgi:NitT/TauT family transport system substrate-binding protein
MLLGACSSGNSSSVGARSTPSGVAISSGKTTLRLGYFPNITHATALVGVEKGIFAHALGPNVTLHTQTFNAGPDAIEALFAGRSTPPTSAPIRPSTGT